MLVSNGVSVKTGFPPRRLPIRSPGEGGDRTSANNSPDFLYAKRYEKIEDPRYQTKSKILVISGPAPRHKMSSYLSNKVKVSPSETSGKGLFADQKIDKNELIADYSLGLGKYVSAQEADILFDSGQDHMIQVDDDLFFAATHEGEFEDSDLVNHSCEPNCGVEGKLKIVAMRDIEPGEEITFDYAMSESSDYKIACNCGKSACRGIITGNDWKIKELQKKYTGYFSDYLQHRITNQALV